MGNKIWVCDDEPSARFPVYTRGNVGEVYSVATSPLTWSAYGRHVLEPGCRAAFYAMGVFTPDEFRPAGECDFLGCFGGYVYLNISLSRVLAVRIPGMTTEAIDKALFGDYPDVPPYRADPRDQNADRTAAVSVWLTSLFTTDAKTETDDQRVSLEALIAKRPDFSSLSDAQLLDYFRSLRPEGRRQLKQHVLNTYGADVLTGLIAQTCQSVGASEFAARVTSAVGDVDSAVQSFELWELSREIRSSGTVTAAFDQGVGGLPERLRACDDPGAKHFLAQWDAFLDRWGFLGPSVWEFRSPTYRTAPEIPLRMLDRARRAADSASPNQRSERLIAERDAAIGEISRRLAGNVEAQNQFVAAARSAGNYLAARERSKTYCTRLMDEARAAVRELGQRLVKRGQLPRWEHVLLVTDDEADAFLVNPAAFSGLIADRATRLAMLESLEPPFVFEGKAPPLSAFKDRNSAKVEIAASGTQFNGIGVSPGRYTGRARVITSLAVDSDLEPGEVIVAITTDASWGPLFLAAGAVVVETGAAISHAAIVSRELGIPAAASVADATRRIPDGSTITVDGNTGTVTVH